MKYITSTKNQGKYINDMTIYYNRKDGLFHVLVKQKNTKEKKRVIYNFKKGIFESGVQIEDGKLSINLFDQLFIHTYFRENKKALINIISNIDCNKTITLTDRNNTLKMPQANYGSTDCIYELTNKKNKTMGEDHK